MFEEKQNTGECREINVNKQNDFVREEEREEMHLRKRVHPSEWIYPEAGSNEYYIHLSKLIVWTCRHGCWKLGLKFNEEGYIKITDLLDHRKFKRYTLEDFKEVIKRDDKYRLTISVNRINDNEEEYYIKANNGHTLILENLDMHKINIDDIDKYPTVVYGTYIKYVNNIKRNGIWKMNQRYIQLTSSIGEGVRYDCECAVFLNIKQALLDGMEIYSSGNHLYTEGIDGIIDSKYFLFFYYFPEINRISFCAGIIILKKNKEKFSVVLVETYKGNMSFTKGKRKGQEYMIDTALREGNEESGIRIEDMTILVDENGNPLLINEFGKPHQPAITYIICIVNDDSYLAKDDHEFLYDHKELKSVKWWDEDEALDYPRLKPERKEVLNIAIGIAKKVMKQNVIL